MRKMSDNKEYATVKKKHDQIESELRSLASEKFQEQLMNLEREVEEAEAAAIADGRLELLTKADDLRAEAREIRQQLAESTRRWRVLWSALEKLRPELAAAGDVAAHEVIADVKPRHEKMVPKIIEILRQLNSALEEEEILTDHLRQEFRSPMVYAITPLAGLLGRGGVPGCEEDYNSNMARILRALKENGYRV